MGDDPPTRTVVRSLLCPSDGLGGDLSIYIDTQGKLLGYWSHSNYLAFFGDQNFGAAFARKSKRAAFGVNQITRLLDFANGTGQTMMIGEYLTGLPHAEAPNDMRGVHWIDVPGMSQLYTSAAPNSTVPDLFYPATRFCPPAHNRPDLNLPCAGGTLDEMTATARSKHSGGVYVCKADGTVHFVSNSINLQTWQAMGAIASGEVAP